MSERLPSGFVYVLPPIDYWTGWSLADQAPPDHPDDGVRRALANQVQETCAHALDEFRARTGWDGDAREGPFVAGLPPTHGGSESDLMVAVKQDDNGLVFVWSPA